MAKAPVVPLREYIRELTAVAPGNLQITLQQIRNTVLAISAGVAPLRSLPPQGFGEPIGQALNEIEGQLLTLLARHRLRPIGSPSEEPRRVMILLGCLPNDTIRSSHLRQVCSYAAAIARHKEIESVAIVTSLETLIEGPDWQFLGLTPDLCRVVGLSPPTTSWISRWGSAVGELAGTEVSRKICVFSPARTEGVYSYSATLHEIMQFSPDVAIMFLGILSTRLLPELLYPHFPIISVQFNVHNPEPRLSDLVLSFGDSDEFQKRSRPDIWHTQLPPVLPFPKHSNLARSRVRGNEDVLIVSALSYGRLEYALMLNSGAFAQGVAAFLSTNPRVGWLFVGVDRPESLNSLTPAWRTLEEDNRVRYLAFAHDLRAIYEHCDIYVHPPCIGSGGMGIAMAIAEGIPALVEQNSDAAAFIARELAYRNQEDLFERMAALIVRPGDRAKIAAVERRDLEFRHSLAAVSDYLYPFLGDARSRFTHRTSGSTLVDRNN